MRELGYPPGYLGLSSLLPHLSQALQALFLLEWKSIKIQLSVFSGLLIMDSFLQRGIALIKVLP
jgi:hypothetical protein